MKYILPSSFLLLSLSMLSCKQEHRIQIREDFKYYYDSFHVEGSFILYDPQLNSSIYYNKPQAHQAFTPASTFKICNSLIGLETGVIPDQYFNIPWDHIVRNPVWDQDHDLQTAFKHSTVWYYQELARRVGGKQMKYWLDQLKYGNADTSGGIDKFWLDGGLRITPMQQISFLQALHENRLPFSKRNLEITRNMMKDIDTLGCKLYGKLGWGGQDGKEIGWFVGYIEKMDHVYYFSNCIQTDSKQMDDVDKAIQFDQSRKQIAYQIWAQLEKELVDPKH